MNGTGTPGGPFDPSVPSVARIYNVFLGGTCNFAVDRQSAAQIMELFPGTAVMARRNRGFLRRAVRYLARDEGITQFADLGSGIPDPDPLHEAARAVNQDARFAYVDSDPVAVAHARRMEDPGVRAASGDVSDPVAILRDPHLLEVIRPGERIALALGLVLHFFPEDEARALVRQYAALLPPGSWMVISVGRNNDAQVYEQVRDLLRRGGMDLYNHSEAAIRSFFDGLDLAHPGVVPVRAWRPDHPEGTLPDADAYALGGAGRVTR